MDDTSCWSCSVDLVISAKRLDNDRIYGKCYGRGTSALGMISRSGKAQQDIQEEIDEELPDLVTAAPPPRTWSSWLNIAEDQAMADLLRAGDLPLWKLARTLTPSGLHLRTHASSPRKSQMCWNRMLVFCIKNATCSQHS